MGRSIAAFMLVVVTSSLTNLAISSTVLLTGVADVLGMMLSIASAAQIMIRGRKLTSRTT